MDRFNPFSSSSLMDDNDPFTTSYNRSSPQHKQKTPMTPKTDSPTSITRQASNPLPSSPSTSSRYTTSFPDPFKDEEEEKKENLELEGDSVEGESGSGGTPKKSDPPTRASNVTFAPSAQLSSSNSPSSAGSRRAGAGRRQVSDAGGTSSFTSFLSRATSVTSSAMTDRVSEAVGSVRSAVDTISSQIQSVPSNINERLSSTASLIGGAEKDLTTTSQEQPQQPSTGGYFASKLSSATNQFTSSSSPSLPIATAASNSVGGGLNRNLPNQLNLLQSQAVGNISRQRVILVLDSIGSTDWVQQFNQYYKSLATTNSSSTSSVGLAQSALTSFFSSATAQLSSAASGVVGVGGSSLTEGGDLIEQADFRDVSVLANQSSCQATVYVTGGSANIGTLASRSLSSSPALRSNGGKIIRPEFVVVRQRTKDNNLQHLRGIVSALNYCLVPTFEPIEVWDVFQDRQMIFSRLLKVQKALGKEHFPLVPQLYCQTHQDLLNYINSQKFIMLPCLACTGPLGKGKIRIENLQTLREFSSIMATNGSSCTIEQFLNVKSDLILQKLGNKLKLFRRNVVASSNNYSQTDYSTTPNSTVSTPMEFDKQQQLQLQQQLQDQHVRQSASRQTSLSSSVLSSLIPTSSASQQQAIARRSSNTIGGQFERLGEVNVRHRNWIEAIQREFDNKLEAFCVKVAVTTDDREYIVGLSDCSMNFMGNQENQDEDRRSFVELILSNMNAILPKNHLSRQSSSNVSNNDSSFNRNNNVGGGTILSPSANQVDHVTRRQQNQALPPDKKKFTSQTQVNGSYVSDTLNNSRSSDIRPNYGQLSSRSQSVSMNQSEYLTDQALMNKSSYFTRRGSERSDSLTATNDSNLELESSGSQTTLAGQHPMGHQRQGSLSQSFFDSTSTALSSFQKQSLSFFKRLDPNSSNTPPQSAKSDKGFATDLFRDDDSIDVDSNQTLTGTSGGGFKSQSMDVSSLDRTPSGKHRKRDAPPKPPPPQSMGYRQSSLATYQRSSTGPGSSVQNGGSLIGSGNITQSGSSTDQQALNTTDQLAGEKNQSSRGKVMRQNSARSTFESYEPDLKASIQSQEEQSGGSARGEPINKSLETTKKTTNFDSASITSGDSNSTGETTTAEDTMNNLKKTFASIFGDKCE